MVLQPAAPVVAAEDAAVAEQGVIGQAFDAAQRARVRRLGALGVAERIGCVHDLHERKHARGFLGVLAVDRLVEVDRFLELTAVERAMRALEVGVAQHVATEPVERAPAGLERLDGALVCALRLDGTIDRRALELQAPRRRQRIGLRFCEREAGDLLQALPKAEETLADGDVGGIALDELVQPLGARGEVAALEGEPRGEVERLAVLLAVGRESGVALEDAAELGERARLIAGGDIDAHERHRHARVVARDLVDALIGIARLLEILRLSVDVADPQQAFGALAVADRKQ